MHIMIVLNDATLWGDQLGALNDHHFMTASVLLVGGYFIYDTPMVLGDLEAEEKSAGAAQIVIHHPLVQSALPVGLLYNTYDMGGRGLWGANLLNRDHSSLAQSGLDLVHNWLGHPLGLHR